MAPAAEKIGEGIKKVDFQDFQILLSTVSWGADFFETICLKSCV